MKTLFVLNAKINLFYQVIKHPVIIFVYKMNALNSKMMNILFVLIQRILILIVKFVMMDKNAVSAKII